MNCYRLKREQKPLDFVQARGRLLFSQARKLAADHYEIIVAGQHQFVLFDFNNANAALAG